MKPVALTLGEPAGIGGEISLKAWDEIRGEVPFFLLGDAKHMRALANSMGTEITVIKSPSEVEDAKHLPVLDHPLAMPVNAGNPTAENSQVVVEMIERAVKMVTDNEACALTTNPIHKKALKDATDFPYPGHTEFLAALSGVQNSVMMLASPELRVVPVTIHIGLNDVTDELTPELLESTIRTSYSALISDFGIAQPRIAIAGLNPHAGEGGTMGKEEVTTIIPVLKKLKDEGIETVGPMSADTMFHPSARAKYDLAICMYHDQALIPIKTIDFSGGVNVTLGLPFVRTSPDHGTAFDIAGKNIADATSLISALQCAWDMAHNRGTV